MQKIAASLLTALLLTVSAPALAETDPYEVKNVVVDITAKDAVNARTEAFVEAQGKAFQQLVKKLRPGVAAADIKKPDDATLGRMVKDFEIASEHVASNRYRGNFIFRFDPAVVAPYLPADTASAENTLTAPDTAAPYGTPDAAAQTFNQAGTTVTNPDDAAYNPNAPHQPVRQTGGYVGNPNAAYNPNNYTGADAANQVVTIMAYFQTLPELNNIKNRLNRSGALSGMTVYSLSYGQAELRGAMVGSMNMLQVELGREGYSLQSQGNNRYQLRRG